MTEQEEFEFRHRLEREQNQAPKWSDLPENAVEGLKETPQTAANMANMARMGRGITPTGLVASAGQAMGGTPLADTETGKALSGIKEGVGHTVDMVKNLPDNIADFAQHPLESTKNHIIEHPISSAIDAASIALPMARGAAETGAKYAGRMGENQMGKLHGTSSQQFRQLGRENFADAMRDSYEAGDANLLQGPIGREEAIKGRVKDLGQQIGDIRKTADEAGPAMTPQEMSDKIRGNLKPDYSAGGKNFEHEAALEKQLNNIQHMPEGGISKFAQRATDINHAATKNKLIQPITAETDVAHQMSRINDENLYSRVPQEVNDEYNMAKEKFGNAKTLLPMEARGEAREATAKGSNTLFGVAKEAAHTALGGPKLGAQVGFGTEGLLKSVAKNAGAYSLGGVTSTLMHTLSTNPQALGKYAAPLAQAAQKNGSQGIAATHFILSQQDPEYGKLMNGSDE